MFESNVGALERQDYTIDLTGLATHATLSLRMRSEPPPGCAPCALRGVSHTPVTKDDTTPTITCPTA